MKWEKAQIEVFKSMLTGNIAARGYWTPDEHRFVVTPDGVHGFVFPRGMIAFDTEQITTCGPFLTVEKAKQNRLIPTTRLREFGNVTARAFEGKDGDVYVNDKYLSCYDYGECEFYCADAHGAVIVVENDAIVGFSLPIAVPEDER